MTDRGHCPRTGAAIDDGRRAGGRLLAAGRLRHQRGERAVERSAVRGPARCAAPRCWSPARPIDLTLRRVCADRTAAKLSALGAVPLLAPDDGDAGDAAAANEAALLQAARGAGAVALLRTTVAPEVAVAAPGPSIGIGIGGFGGGYRSGGGVGFGVSAPLGGAGPVETGYGATASLTDVASGR